MSSFYHAQSGRTFYAGGGIAGRSAYDEAVYLGLFRGSPAEFVEWLRGQPGEAGPEGASGEAGTPGPAGAPGPVGPPLRFRPPVATLGDRPATADEGDLVLVEATGEVWTWRDGAWAFPMPWPGSISDALGDIEAALAAILGGGD